MAKPKKKTTKQPKEPKAPTFKAPDVGKPGRKHRTPLAVAYQSGAKVVVALMHPTNDTAKIHEAGGVHTALGMFRDDGYDFGPLRDPEAVPQWALDRLPTGCTAIGCAPINVFPFA